MPEDRELLEMAAKAAGYDTKHSMNAERLESDPPVDSLLIRDSGKHLLHTGWNPLTDDGNALQLAVKLHMMINITQIETHAYYSKGIADGCITDSCARRAIVRAAAEIGKAQA